LFFALGYGLRVRGAEGLGHGPGLAVGVQLPSRTVDFDLQVSGQYLFRSEFEARPFTAAVQTSALRVQVGIEPRLRSSLFGQVMLGLGADVARIGAAPANSLAPDARAVPRANGTQFRSVGELTLGVLQRGDLFDWGVSAQVSFAFADVHYSVVTSAGETTVGRPWLLQPALSIYGRFRSAL